MPSLIRRWPFAGALLPRPPAGGLVSRPPNPARVQSPPSAHAPASASPAATAAALVDLRGAAMRRFFPKLYAWWSNRREWGVALQAYAYLAEATTVADLEERIREVERQIHFRH